MTELAIDRPPARENGNGWRSTLLGALFIAFMAVVGWVETAAQTARFEMAKKLDEQQQQISEQQQRTAVLEEAMRGLMRSMDRIESGVNELRRDPRRPR